MTDPVQRRAIRQMPVSPETLGDRLHVVLARLAGTVSGRSACDEAGLSVPALVHQGHEPWSSRLRSGARQPDLNRLRYHAANVCVRQHVPSRRWQRQQQR